MPDVTPGGVGHAKASATIAQAEQALREATRHISPDEPFAPVMLRARRLLGEPADGGPVLKHWASRAPGNALGERRYRWELTHRYAARPASAGPDQWRAWRPAEQPLLEDDRFAFEARLSAPLVCSESAELLAERAGAGDPGARALLEEALPVLRAEFARHAQVLRVWQDTFALWCLGRQPRLFALLHPIALALASSCAAEVAPEATLLRGKRFPFHDLPLPSASAQLATSLLALGADLPLVSRLVEGVGASRGGEGGWGDGGGPADTLTTLVAADLLLHVDPSFDLAPTAALLGRLQSPDGLWRALGPESVWLTTEVLTLFARAGQRFADRFRWPYLPSGNRDHKTGLPFYAYFADLARLFAALPGLARAHIELAFIDLAGFRAFNNRFGQDQGDLVLAHFAATLDAIAPARAIRDGGDEFLLVGAPTLRGLADRLAEFRRAWPARFRERFGPDVPPVAPRVLVLRAGGDVLMRAREDLGRRLTSLKQTAAPGPEGVLVDLGTF